MRPEGPLNIPERIVCAAIWYTNAEVPFHHAPRNIDHGVVAIGLRHNNCYGILMLLFPDRRHILERACVHGFITSDNRFVDRLEAEEIALLRGQIPEKGWHIDGLHSEDLY